MTAGTAVGMGAEVFVGCTMVAVAFGVGVACVGNGVTVGLAVGAARVAVGGSAGLAAGVPVGGWVGGDEHPALTMITNAKPIISVQAEMVIRFVVRVCISLWTLRTLPALAALPSGRTGG